MAERKRVVRNYPINPVEDALAIPQKIQDEKAGRPFKRLLLADALGIKPSSSNFRDLLSSSFKYGLTGGTERGSEVSLTALGNDATQTTDPAKRLAAIRKAVLTPPLLGDFYTAYSDRKLPSPEMMDKLLVADYGVPKVFAAQCAQLIVENGRFAEIIRDIGGSAHVLLDADVAGAQAEGAAGEETAEVHLADGEAAQPVAEPAAAAPPEPPRAIFVSHGKKKKPLEKLQKILTSFQIPHKVAGQEPSLGRPIPQKVKDVMLQCGSAILIFSCDEKFLDQEGNEVWRPSENVVHELGAASFAYGDRVVIFKERGISFPTNFQSIGYIEFEEDGIESKTAELLKELIGFGLVKFTTA